MRHTSRNILFPPSTHVVNIRELVPVDTSITENLQTQ